MIDYTQSKLYSTWPIWSDEELHYFQSCLEKGDWSRGQATLDFEQAFAEFCGYKYALLINQ